LFTLFLRISVPSNWKSIDVTLFRIGEKVEQSDNFVYLQRCSRAGTRGNDVPVNIFVRERSCGKHVSLRRERR